MTMTLPPNTGLTIDEVRRLAVALARRRGIHADLTLDAEILAIAEEIVLDQALATTQGTLEPPVGLMQGGTGSICRYLREN